MRFNEFQKICLALTVSSALATSPALAAKRKTKLHKPSPAPKAEIYEATDEDPMETSASAITLPPGQAPGIAPAAPIAPLAPVAVSDAPAPRWQSAGYDSVPANQAEGVARRLALIEELIRKHGRAYDYRVLTVKDLEAILATLEQDHSETSSSDQ